MPLAGFPQNVGWAIRVSLSQGDALFLLERMTMTDTSGCFFSGRLFCHGGGTAGGISCTEGNLKIIAASVGIKV